MQLVVPWISLARTTFDNLTLTTIKTSHSGRPRWSGPAVWDGAVLGQNEDWITHLSKNDLTEINSAVEYAKLSGEPLSELTRENFPFDGLGDRLIALRNEILEGRGFAVIRGLGDNRWNNEDLIRAYWAIGSWFGNPVSQNARGHLLGHIIDQRSPPSPEKRLYQTNVALPFHSDSCDIVGLLCLRTTSHGGASALASAPAIHNALLDRDPASLEQLYGEFHCDRYGEIPAGKHSSYPVHIFNSIKEKFVCCGMDPDIRSAQRLTDVPPLSQEQIQALDSFQETANSLALRMHLQPGDIQLVNNLTVVHAREQYQDDADPDKRRYLIRLWLSSPLGRALPDFMAERWGNIVPGTIRGGIVVPGAVATISFSPDQ